jgi:hypothetical protein
MDAKPPTGLGKRKPTFFSPLFECHAEMNTSFDSFCQVFFSALRIGLGKRLVRKKSSLHKKILDKRISLCDNITITVGG